MLLSSKSCSSGTSSKSRCFSSLNGWQSSVSALAAARAGMDRSKNDRYDAYLFSKDGEKPSKDNLEDFLILDGVKYLRLVCSEISSQKDGDPPLAVQNALLKFILTEQDIRDHITKWGNDNRDQRVKSSSKIQIKLIHNQQYDRVKTEAQKYFTEQSDT